MYSCFRNLLKSEDPKAYAKLASEGVLLGYPVKIGGSDKRSDNGVSYHSTIKEFDHEKDHPHSIHELAQHMPLNPPDAKNTQIEPGQFKDRFGNDVFVIKLKGNSAEKLKEHNAKFAHMGVPSNYSWEPHISVPKDIHDQIKSSGAKTAHEAGIEFSAAQLKHGPKILKVYHHESDSAEPRVPDLGDMTAKMDITKKSEAIHGEKPLMKPYVSDAQRRWAHTSSGKEALGGEKGVHEWDEASKGKKLPEKVGKSEKVCLTKPEFVEEHKKLVETLKYPTKEKIKEEIREQSKELKEKIGKTEPVSAPKNVPAPTTSWITSRQKVDAGDTLHHHDGKRYKILRANHGTMPSQPHRYFVKEHPSGLEKSENTLEKGLKEAATAGLMGLASLGSQPAHADYNHVNAYLNSMKGKIPNAQVETALSPGVSHGKISVGKFHIHTKAMLGGKSPISNHEVSLRGPDEKTWTPQDRQDYANASYIHEHLGKVMPKLMEMTGPVKKSEQTLEKGLLQNAGVALGMAAATVGHAGVKDRSPASIPHHAGVATSPVSTYDHGKMLRTIAQVESNNGANTNHKPAESGEVAYGKYALMPNTIHDTIKGHKDLRNKHSKALALTGPQLHRYMQDHKGLEDAIADRHLSHIEHRLGKDPEQAGYAWFEGIQRTLNDRNAKKDIKNHFHVKKIKEAYDKGK